MYIELIGFIGGSIAAASNVPQIWKCLQTGNTSSISWSMIFIFIIGAVFSLIYGVLIEKIAIIATVSISIFEFLVLLSIKWYYEIYMKNTISHTFVKLDNKIQKELNDMNDFSKCTILSQDC